MALNLPTQGRVDRSTLLEELFVQVTVFRLDGTPTVTARPLVSNGGAPADPASWRAPQRGYLSQWLQATSSLRLRPAR